MVRRLLLALLALGLVLASGCPTMAQTPAKKPNILIIWGDDIGYWNVSAYNQGMMGMDYSRWRIEHVFLLVPGQQFVGQFLATFKDFPPSQRPGSFSIDAALQRLQEAGGGR